jgi:mannan endo-1,4-beta-mannosidase
MKITLMKNSTIKFWLLTIIIGIYSSSIYGTDDTTQPVTPNASPEAKALLKFIYSISEKYMLTGQHNYPNVKLRNTEFAASYIGKTPVIYSTDWGFAKDGDTDSHLARPDIVKQAIEQHRKGALITICWHAVPPTADEPITFRPLPGKSNLDSLATVQGQLLDRQFKDVLTPGTFLYKHWCSQVDSIAFYLKKLQDAHVPILWRPYHEMNGNWFWWGARTGNYNTAALYRQLFDRLVKRHKLNNLIWVWSVDRPNKPEMQYSYFYPGNQYLDILSLDVYRNDFNQVYYDSLVAISKGKPLALGEVGNPPTLDILKNQPKWTYYVTWSGMVRNTSKKQYDKLLTDTHVLSMEDTAYWIAVSGYRIECGLPQLPVAIKENRKPNFSGKWLFNEGRSKLDNAGAANLPYILNITQNDSTIKIQITTLLEYSDNSLTEESLTLDGKECRSEIMNSPKIMTAKWSGYFNELLIDSKVTLNWGNKPSEMIVNETWKLLFGGNCLSIKQHSKSFWGERNIEMVFDRVE